MPGMPSLLVSLLQGCGPPRTNVTRSESKAAGMTLAKLQGSVRQSFDHINDDLKVVHSGLNKYSKVLDKV